MSGIRPEPFKDQGLSTKRIVLMKRFLIATIALIAAASATTNPSYDEGAMLMVMPFITQLKATPTIIHYDGDTNTTEVRPNPDYDPKVAAILAGVPRDYDTEATRYHVLVSGQSQN
jgi:hypothetical protein